MNRALFGDEPLTGFITICCFLVFNFVFYFLQRYCRKVAPLCVEREKIEYPPREIKVFNRRASSEYHKEQPSCKYAIGC
jgi:hypothetical protein